MRGTGGSATSSWRAARKGFLWKVGEPKHPGHPRHPGRWQSGLAAKQALSCESWESRRSWPRRGSREAVWCLPGQRPAAKSAKRPGARLAADTSSAPPQDARNRGAEEGRLGSSNKINHHRVCVPMTPMTNFLKKIFLPSLPPPTNPLTLQPFFNLLTI